MNPTKTTVQALLSVLVGRDPAQVIMIEDNQLRIVETINLLSTDSQSMGQMYQAAKALDEKLVARELPAAICNADTKTNPELRELVNQPLTVEESKPIVKRTQSNVINGYRPWCSEEIKVMAGLATKGVSLHDIGKAFGRTARAIDCQLHYLRNPESRPVPKPRVTSAVQ